MRHYKEIRFCRVCKTRFVVEQKKPSSYYCSACREKYNKYKEKEHKEELEKEKASKEPSK